MDFWDKWLKPLVGIISALGGIAALYTYAVRPRLFRDFRTLDLVRCPDEERQRKLEEVLQEQRQPTHMLEAEWWNNGRRAAEDLRVQILIPGRVLSWDITPGSSDYSAGWELDSSAKEADEGTAIRLSQRLLAAGARNRAVVWYNVRDRKLEARVEVHEGRRLVGNGDSINSSLSGGLNILVMGVTFLVLILLFESGSFMFYDPEHPISLLIGIAAVVVIAAVFWGTPFVLYKFASRFERLFSAGKPSWKVK
jgi:hypothetical protein